MANYRSFRRIDLVNSAINSQPVHFRKSEFSRIYLCKGTKELITPLSADSSSVMESIINSCRVDFSQSDILHALKTFAQGNVAATLSDDLLRNIGSQSRITAASISLNAETVADIVNKWANNLKLKNANLTKLSNIIVQSAVLGGLSKAKLISGFTTSKERIPARDRGVFPTLQDIYEDYILKVLATEGSTIVSSALSSTLSSVTTKIEITSFISAITRDVARMFQNLQSAFINLGVFNAIVNVVIDQQYFGYSFYPENVETLGRIVDEIKNNPCFSYMFGTEKQRVHVVSPVISIDANTKSVQLSTELGIKLPALSQMFDYINTMYHTMSFDELISNYPITYQHDASTNVSSVSLFDPVYVPSIPQVISKTWVTSKPLPRNNLFKAIMPSSLNEVLQSTGIAKLIRTLADPSIRQRCELNLSQVITDWNYSSNSTLSPVDQEVSIFQYSELSAKDQYFIKFCLAHSLADEVLVVNMVPFKKLEGYDTFMSADLGTNNDISATLLNSADDACTTDTSSLGRVNFSSVNSDVPLGLEGLSRDTTNRLYGDGKSPDYFVYNNLLSNQNHTYIFRMGPNNNTFFTDVYNSGLNQMSGSFTVDPHVMIFFAAWNKKLSPNIPNSDGSVLNAYITNAGAEFEPGITTISSLNIPNSKIKLVTFNPFRVSIKPYYASPASTNLSTLSFDIDITSVVFNTPNFTDYAVLDSSCARYYLEVNVQAMFNLIEQYLALVKKYNINSNVRVSLSRTIFKPLLDAFNDVNVINTIKAFIANEGYRLAFNHEFVSEFVKSDIMEGVKSIVSTSGYSLNSSLPLVIASFSAASMMNHKKSDLKNVTEVANDLCYDSIISFS